MRLKKVKVPEKGFLAWLRKNFGIGGFENYTHEQQISVLHILALALRNMGPTEMSQLGKILLQLAQNSEKLNNAFEEFNKEGIFEMFNLQK
jgi:hypothetical protein